MNNAQVGMLAMDLGTSNTCLISYNDAGEEMLRPRDYCNAAMGGTVPTLVLYNGVSPLTIGAQAEAEFGEASLREREHYKLCALFKPDVDARAEARQEMTDFLRLLRHAVCVPDNVLVGIPSEAGNLYKECLRACLQQAGWGQVRFLSEPLGAVIHYLVQKKISPAQAARGVLTVDFGGGTCDFAFLRRAAVSARSGDVLLGGRLFDDLFWQILLEGNPGLEEVLAQEGNSYYVHWLACRQAKEEFSRAMCQNKERAVTLRVSWSAWNGDSTHERALYIENLDWHGFLLRAGQYRASSSLLALLRGHEEKVIQSAHGRALLEGKKIDLVQWFEDTLRESLTMAGHDGIPTVLLTGGSSAWPFVQEKVRQQLGHDAVILIGDEPYADIARGLARYESFSAQLRRGRAALDKSLPYFLQHQLADAVQHVLNSVVEEILDAFALLLREAVIISSCVQFRQQGESLQDLHSLMIHNLAPQMISATCTLDKIMQSLVKDIEYASSESLQQWFAEKGIPILPERLRCISPGDTKILLAKVQQNLSQAALTAIHDKVVNGLLVCLLMGGGGVGLLCTLPAGPVALPVAVSMAWLGGAVFKHTRSGQKIVEHLHNIAIPKRLRAWYLDDKRIAHLADKVLQEFRNSLRVFLLTEWETVHKYILAETDRVVREEIDALDILHVTPS